MVNESLGHKQRYLLEQLKRSQTGLTLGEIADYYPDKKTALASILSMKAHGIVIEVNGVFYAA